MIKIQTLSSRLSKLVCIFLCESPKTFKGNWVKGAHDLPKWNLCKTTMEKPSSTDNCETKRDTSRSNSDRTQNVFDILDGYFSTSTKSKRFYRNSISLQSWTDWWDCLQQVGNTITVQASQVVMEREGPAGSPGGWTWTMRSAKNLYLPRLALMQAGCAGSLQCQSPHRPTMTQGWCSDWLIDWLIDCRSPWSIRSDAWMTGVVLSFHVQFCRLFLIQSVLCIWKSRSAHGWLWGSSASLESPSHPGLVSTGGQRVKEHFRRRRQETSKMSLAAYQIRNRKHSLGGWRGRV